MHFIEETRIMSGIVLFILSILSDALTWDLVSHPHKFRKSMRCLIFAQLILFIQAFKQTVQRPLKRYFRSPWTAKWSDTLRLISLLTQIFFLENPWNQFTTLSIIHYETHTWILASESDKIITFFSFPTGAYYCLNMIMITLSTFLAVIVIHLYFRGPRTNRVPYWVKRVRNK